jgi:putative NIF3 family GTP cyclohydrolase 1 type 2
MSFEDFCELVKEKLDAPVITAAKASETVSRLALLGGGGKDYIYAAKETGADAYLTGEASYNAILDGGENGISVIAAGHYHTEWQFREFFKKALGDDFEYVDFPLGYELYHA